MRMKHALLLFLKKRQNFKCRLLQIIGDALRVKTMLYLPEDILETTGRL